MSKQPTRALLFLLVFPLAVGLFGGQGATAATSEADLVASFRDRIASVNVYGPQELLRSGAGFLVSIDQASGYLLTTASLLDDRQQITVTPSGRATELSADLVRIDPALDIAILRVSGLGGSALVFASSPPEIADVVRTIGTAASGGTPLVTKGSVLSAYQAINGRASFYSHSAAAGLPNAGADSLLINDCGQVVGITVTGSGSDGNPRALAAGTLRGLLADQGIRSAVASEPCLSDVVKARTQAELASETARRASADAEAAQQVSRNLEQQLRASNQRNERLEAEALLARQRADEAIEAAELAKQNVLDTQAALERQTDKIKADTEAMLKVMERDRDIQERRFQEALREQREAAATNTRMMMIAAGVLIIAILAAAFILRTRGGNRPVAPSARAVDRKLAVAGGGDLTEMHKQELVEYVLDGRDEDGIRYLLRISGDKLIGPEGVVIGRNPKDSPYIINHNDVSRRHARIKLLKNRIFIEDLGSTNGTSVNGQSIEDKGPVSVADGDQIIIGSVVMKLRVLDA